MKLRFALILLMVFLSGCVSTGGTGISGKVRSADGLYTIDLSSQWQTLRNVNNEASFQAARRDNRGYLMIYTAPYDRIKGRNLEEISAAIAESLAEDMRDGEFSTPVYGYVGDLRAVFYLIQGGYKNLTLSHVLVIIQGDRALYIAKASCQERDFDHIGANLFRTILTLREL
jgi:hypothetical protein